jgi:hypothetical protein
MCDVYKRLSKSAESNRVITEKKPLSSIYVLRLYSEILLSLPPLYYRIRVLETNISLAYLAG